MTIKIISLITCLLLQLFYCNNIIAEVYKWIDENGNVVYGDKPVSKKDADQIKIKKAPQQDAHTKKRLEKQDKLLDVFAEERDAKLAKEQKEREEKEKKQKQCAEIRKELQEMQQASFLYEDTDDPYNPKIISDEERKKAQNEYANYLKKNC